MSAVLRLLRNRAQARCATIGGMRLQVHSIPGTTALVLDSPHSGIHYPADFGHACDPQVLRRAEDTHVEKLYDFAGEMGAAWVEALFPRSYIDVNRSTGEVDDSMLQSPWPGPMETDFTTLAKVRMGKGLIWRCTDEGIPIYDRKLSVAEVRRRIDNCWTPYHKAVGTAIASARARHGYSIHVNCHSMPAIAGSHATQFPGLVHADFVIGDRDGTTASPALSQLVCDYLRGLGYSVAYNHPYRGVELVRRHGAPELQRHSIQLEVNRRLYMDEKTLIPTPGLQDLKADLRRLMEVLLGTDARLLASRDQFAGAR